MKYSEKIAYGSIGIIRAIAIVMSPFVRFLTFSTNIVSKIFGVSENEEETDGGYQHRHKRHSAVATVASKSEQGDDPRRDCRADVGAHHHGDGATQRQQAGAGKAYGHHRRRRRTLDDGGHPRTGQDAAQGLAGNLGEDVAQLGTGILLQTLAHQLHSEKEDGQSTHQVQNNKEYIPEVH